MPKENWEVEFERLFGHEIKEVQKEFPKYLSHDPDIKSFISGLLKKRDEETIEVIKKVDYKNPKRNKGHYRSVVIQALTKLNKPIEPILK